MLNMGSLPIPENPETEEVPLWVTEEQFEVINSFSDILREESARYFTAELGREVKVQDLPVVRVEITSQTEIALERQQEDRISYTGTAGRVLGSLYAKETISIHPRSLDSEIKKAFDVHGGRIKAVRDFAQRNGLSVTRAETSMASNAVAFTLIQLILSEFPDYASSAQAWDAIYSNASRRYSEES
jgi:hypothetical protein